jgi:hypothetical protein
MRYFESLSELYPERPNPHRDTPEPRYPQEVPSVVLTDKALLSSEARFFGQALVYTNRIWRHFEPAVVRRRAKAAGRAMVCASAVSSLIGVAHTVEAAKQGIAGDHGQSVAEVVLAEHDFAIATGLDVAPLIVVCGGGLLRNRRATIAASQTNAVAAAPPPPQPEEFPVIWQSPGHD